MVRRGGADGNGADGNADGNADGRSRIDRRSSTAVGQPDRVWAVRARNLVRLLLWRPDITRPKQVVATVVALFLLFAVGLAIGQFALVMAGVRHLGDAIGNYIPSVGGAAIGNSLFVVACICGSRQGRDSRSTESDGRS